MRAVRFVLLFVLCVFGTAAWAADFNGTFQGSGTAAGHDPQTDSGCGRDRRRQVERHVARHPPGANARWRPDGRDPHDRRHHVHVLGRSFGPQSPDHALRQRGQPGDVRVQRSDRWTESTTTGPPVLAGAADWFAMIGGQQAGPFTAEDILSQDRRGRDRARHADLAAWRAELAGCAELCRLRRLVRPTADLIFPLLRRREWTAGRPGDAGRCHRADRFRVAHGDQ